jgi:hypothetical protein
MNHLNNLPRKHYSHQKVTFHPTPCKREKSLRKMIIRKLVWEYSKAEKKNIQGEPDAYLREDLSASITL